MRIAFVHPGQGALRSGMAAAWRGHPAGQVIDEVGERAGLDLWTLADDPASGADTAVAQPAILAVSLAASRALTDAGIRPAFVAGHSLGECTAAIVGGALSVADGAEVVAERGRAMGAACRANPGTMAAIIKLDRDEVDRLVARVPDAQVANDNAPGQVVVSGPVHRRARRLPARAGRHQRRPRRGARHLRRVDPDPHRHPGSATSPPPTRRPPTSPRGRQGGARRRRARASRTSRAVVVATTTPDHPVPGTAPIVAAAARHRGRRLRRQRRLQRVRLRAAVGGALAATGDGPCCSSAPRP
jgi:hypothetical protein